MPEGRLLLDPAMVEQIPQLDLGAHCRREGGWRGAAEGGKGGSVMIGGVEK